MTIIVLGLSSGCSKQSEVVSADDLLNRIYGIDPLSHTAYIGTDSKHHHFRWSKGNGSGTFLVKSSDLSLPETFSVGSGSRFLYMNPDGEVEFWKFGAQYDPSG